MSLGTFVSIPGIAAICYDAIRRYSLVLGEGPVARWEDAPGWLRMGFINSIVNIAAGTARAPREVHATWIAEKSSEGWRPGPLDPETKQHPSLVPFDRLPPAGRVRVYLFFTIASTLLGLRGAIADPPPAEPELYNLLIRRVRDTDDVEALGRVQLGGGAPLDATRIALFGDADSWHGSFMCAAADWDGVVGDEIHVSMHDGRSGTAWISHLAGERWSDTVEVDFVGKSTLA